MLMFSALDSILSKDFDFMIILWCLLSSLAFGLVLAISYRVFKRKSGFSIDLPLNLILMPLITAVIVLVSRVIGLNSTMERTTLAFSFAGILAISRFRSTQKDASDLVFISTSIVLGFLNGLGYLFISFLTLGFCVITIVLVYLTGFDNPSNKEMTLKIIVPEDLNYDNLFDDLLNEYSRRWNLKSIKTTSFGTMFELTFIVILKDTKKQKEFIDKLRTRNGNLNISLSVRKFNSVIEK